MELLGNNWRIVGMFFEYWFMSPRGIFTHVEIILQLLDCLGQVYAGLYKFCIWVELPVQRRLCPIF